MTETHPEKRLIGYARVSTYGQTLDSQLEQLRAAGMQQPGHLPRERTGVRAARALLAIPDIGATQIAHRLGVSPATLYRYIPAARTANTPDVCGAPRTLSAR